MFNFSNLPNLNKLPIDSFDKLLFHHSNNAIHAFSQSDLYNSLFTNFGINDFNFFIPIVCLVGGYGFAKWLDIKLKTNGQFTNTIKTTVNSKPILFTIGSIMIIVIIML